MRKIIHIDMDCFYAAVECKYNPELRGLPLGIGGPPESRSVLCTASYEARKFGVRAAMPSSMAKRLCPQLVLRPPRFDLYKKESQDVHSIFRRFTDKVEPLSLDEAYLDVTDSPYFQGSATRIAQEIRRLIFLETGLTASAGVGPNKFLAKVASDWKKPNGMYVIEPGQVSDFMRTLPVEKLFGVGKVTAARLHELKLFTCEDIQKADLLLLKKVFGSRSFELWQLAHGIDSRAVVSEWEPRSMTVEETFDHDLMTLDEIYNQLPQLYQQWQSRFVKAGHTESEIAGLVVKVKFYDFKQTTHEISCRGKLPQREHFEPLIEKAFSRGNKAVRLVGIGVRFALDKSGVESQQLSLIS